MIDTLISLAVLIVVAVIFWWAITKLMGAFNAPSQIQTVVTVVFVVIVALAILGTFFGGWHTGIHITRP